MSFLTRFGDRHDRKDKKKTTAPDRSQSVDPTTKSVPPPLSPTRSEEDYVEEEELDAGNDAASSHLHGGSRRTVSISRSGRYKFNKERSRILSEDVYSGTAPVSASASSSPSPTTATTPSLSLAQPVPLLQPKVQPKKKKKDLVKPSARDKSPARPYIILKTDSSVNFAIESTTL